MEAGTVDKQTGGRQRSTSEPHMNNHWCIFSKIHKSHLYAQNCLDLELAATVAERHRQPFDFAVKIMLGIGLKLRPIRRTYALNHCILTAQHNTLALTRTRSVRKANFCSSLCCGFATVRSRWVNKRGFGCAQIAAEDLFFLFLSPPPPVSASRAEKQSGETNVSIRRQRD